jgi:Ca2+-binding RTX toxin-like protein
VNGENGLDTLYGGAGEDLFLFDTNAYNNIDVVKDFSVAQDDKLDFNAILDFNPLSDDIADFLTLTNSGSNTQVFADRDGTGGGYSSVQVALLEGVTNLDVEDLLLSGNLIAA